MFKEFKKFIARGNVLELAVGLVMGTYFGAIVKSLVNDIIMPPLGKILGGVDFSNLKIIIQEGQPAVMQGDTEMSPAVEEIAVTYGNFINTIITFLIVAWVIFLVVKAYNKYMKKEEAKPEPATPPPPSKEVELLIEIRDELRKKGA
ncbi:MAG TPA: large conductance mechanosensitive channel protein MscL [Cryomorphaceae bacterium]|nr:large conductance mechanosensitive channel protein MscL [Owenweeksia sp.]MBF98864.1 large conductance mechanosensitive channel protein MscL [Owenweeksia sp.]HAD97669.1 large conductance mechanosensitive channel protein MscL [Cryomorphaceae bacterium]HBF22161.1 large conductance mechanosensitive channel protein MscL [Cryomorphaceae bacterium]|tara:strand:- start:127 stop:567 length:441 start_codon:yes stop_codon:yes gene_type:complete